jgi:BirA family biotin operon repressor/biotin-[acetyl-CoA-carboxylase] ligase
LPLSELALTHALERIGAQAPVRFDEVTRSTQLTARSLAEEGAPEWTLVAAAHQTEGRGRLDREWVDEPGGALMFSLVLRPDLPPERGGLISLLAGWALAVACREAAGVEARCKWPNDLIVGKGKAGGIIAESTLRSDGIEHVLLGVGVNVAAAPAVAGAAALGDVEPAEVLDSFLVAFAGRYEPGHPAFPGATVSAYRKVCATIGAWVRVTTTAGLVTEGEAVDLDDAGGLVVRTDDGLEVVRFGDVEQLRRGETGASG